MKNAVVRNVRVTGLTGPLIGLYHVTGKGLEGAAAIDGPKLPDAVPSPAEPYLLR